MHEETEEDIERERISQWEEFNRDIEENFNWEGFKKEELLA